MLIPTGASIKSFIEKYLVEDVFFENVIEELGYKLNFEAVANYAGNSFCEKSWDMIQTSNAMRWFTRAIIR